jgi:hypothetical protein
MHFIFHITMKLYVSAYLRRRGVIPPGVDCFG